jgi:hypothetical protein
MREERFFGQRIVVRCERDEGGFSEPREFLLGDEAVRVVEVLRRWHDSGFDATTRSRTWLERHHRTHYRVRVEDGGIYELYMDRTGSRRVWFLARRLAHSGAADTCEPLKP